MFFAKTRSMSPADAADGLRSGQLTLVDVREPGELHGGRINGSRNIPLGQLRVRMGELEGDKPVAFICRSGARSARATRAAAKAGIDAANVTGGVIGWAGAGLPLR